MAFALMNIIEAVKNIIVNQVGVKPDDVTPEADFVTDFGVDSLGTIELVMALEDYFHVEIPDEAIERMHKVKDVHNYLLKMLAKGTTG